MLITTRGLATIKSLPQRQEIPDSHMPGLYLVVQPSGAKSWAVRYRSNGQPRKHTLGSYPKIDLKAARALAGTALRAVAEGSDPASEKTRARTTPPDTVEAVIERFIELHCRRANRPRTIKGTLQLFDLHVLPRWRRRLLKDITRRDVLDLLDEVVASGRPVAANRALTAIRKMCNWAVERDILPASPCAGVKPPTREQSRDRVLSDSELFDIWQAADTLGGPFGALVKLLMLTAQRRDEVACMEWREVDLPARMWTLPKERAKNNESHDIPLSEPAVAVLEAVPRIGSTYVLTTGNGTAAAANFGLYKQRLDALLPDMPHWQLHDLRRTAASGMARLGVSLPVVERILNHKGKSFSGVAGIYQRYDFGPEQRVALERWGAHVAALVSGRHSENVVRLEPRA